MTFLTHLIAILLIKFSLLLSLSVVISKTRILSLGHLAFFGIGALLSAFVFRSIAPEWSLLVALVAATAGAAGCSRVLAAASLRLRRDYFILLSAATSELLLGVSLLLAGPAGFNQLERPRPFGVVMDSDFNVVVFLLLPFVLLSAYVYRRLSTSRIDLICSAVRTNEHFSQLLGIDPYYYKSLCLTLSAVGAAVAGVLATVFTRSTDPFQLSLENNLLLFAVLLFGGLNTVIGSLVASVMLTVIPIALERALGEIASVAFYAGQLQQLGFGLLLLLTIRFMPTGMAGIGRLDEPVE